PRGDGPSHPGRAGVLPARGGAAVGWRPESDHRGVLRQDHRRRSWRMGGQPGGTTLRRDGLHGRIRGGTAVPRYADPGDRRRNHRNPHRTGRQDTWIPIVTVMSSTLDPASPAFTEAASATETKLEEMAGEFAKALAGGGAKYVARHHDRGKL